MKILKKTVTLLLALGMTLGVTACNLTGGSSGSSESSVGGDSQNSEQTSVEATKMTETEWNAFVQEAYKETNFVATYVGKTQVNEEDATITSTVKCDGEKVYTEVKQETSLNTTTYEMYYVEENGKIFQYFSGDGQPWSKEDMTEIMDGENPFIAKYYLFNYLSTCTYSGSGGVEFNKKTNTYTFSELGGKMTDVTVSGDKITKIVVSGAENGNGEINITYGNATIGDLPTVTE